MRGVSRCPCLKLPRDELPCTRQNHSAFFAEFQDFLVGLTGRGNCPWLHSGSGNPVPTCLGMLRRLPFHGKILFETCSCSLEYEVSLWASAPPSNYIRLHVSDHPPCCLYIQGSTHYTCRHLQLRSEKRLVRHFRTQICPLLSLRAHQKTHTCGR